MLPFLDKKTVSTIISRRNGRDLEKNAEEAAPGEDDSLHWAAEDIMRALEAKSPAHLADALKTFFYLCDAEPHVEGPHESEE